MITREMDLRTDEVVKRDVVDQLYWDTRIDASDVTVAVDNGTVTLSGSVPTQRAKQAAFDDAWVVSGVTSVLNQLEVKYATSLTIPEDEDIRANIESVLLWNPNLAIDKLNVDVTGGWVTLEGSVDAYWKKIEAENDVLSIRGVIGITNKLAVVPTEEFVDESIAEDVVEAIDRNARVNVDNVNVTVENGKVILTGTVPNWSAKSAVYDSALYTAGVIDVEDNTIVEYEAVTA